ncbi:unnamed protein product [Closterium sp. NIES-53]
MDMWGPACARGTDQERYFLLVVDDYSRYGTVSPLRSKADVTGFFILWIRAAHHQLREQFGRDLLVLRLHSNRGGEFSSGLLAEFYQDQGIRQMFTLPASPQQNGISELWPFAVRYAAHQLNLWPRVSLPKTSPTLRWTGEVGDASAFRVWGVLSLVCDTTASKLSPLTLRCAFLGFPTDAPPWQFYHPRSHGVLHLGCCLCACMRVCMECELSFKRISTALSWRVRMAPGQQASAVDMAMEGVEDEEEECLEAATSTEAAGVADTAATTRTTDAVADGQEGRRAGGGRGRGRGGRGGRGGGAANMKNGDNDNDSSVDRFPGQFFFVSTQSSVGPEKVEGFEENAAMGKVNLHSLDYSVIDSGATYSMTPRADLLTELELSLVKHVISALGQQAEVKGMGKAMFKGADGKMVGLKNVLLKPNLPVNLISVRRLQKTGMDTSSKGAKTYTARLGERILWDLHEDKDVYNEMWQIPVVSMPKDRQVVACVNTKGEAVGSGDDANDGIKEDESKKCNLGGTIKQCEHKDSGEAAKEQKKGEENPDEAAEVEYGESMWGTIASAALSNLSSATGECDWLTLQRRMGHVALPILQQLVKGEMVAGIRVKGEPTEVLGCPTCMQAKLTRFLFSSSEATAKAPLDEVVMDVVGPLKLGAAEAEYFLTIVDVYTCMTWVYVLSKKSDVAETVKTDWLPMVERQQDWLVKSIRTDRGGDFLSKEFRLWLKKNGIRHSLTKPYSPAMNSIAERANRIITETARRLLIEAGLPDCFWLDAVRSACVAKNRALTHVGADKWVPYVEWIRRKPKVDMLPVFRCMCMALVPKHLRHNKLGAKAIWAVHLFMAQNSKGWLLWNPFTKKFLVSWDCKFMENLMYKDWKAENEAKSSGLEHVEMTLELRSGSTTTRQSTLVNGGEEAKDAEEEEEEVQQTSKHAPTLPSRATSAPRISVTLQQRHESLHVPAGEEEGRGKMRIQAPNRLTYDATGKPAKSALAGAAMMVGDDEEFEYEEFAFAFFSPVEMPGEPATLKEALESSDNEEQKKAMESELKSIEENGTWELVELPEGRKAITSKWLFKIKSDADGKIEHYKSRLVAKGYQQKEKVDYKELFALVEIGFTPSSADHSLFILREGEQRSFMVVYMDDIFIFVPSSDLVKEGMLKLQDKFKCKALGDVSFYLGLHIERDVEKRCMRVHQRKYLQALAANFGQIEGHVANPFPSGLKCVKGPEEESVGEEERRRFHSLVGSLMYAAVNTRLDITFATGQLDRVVQCPNEEQAGPAPSGVSQVDPSPLVESLVISTDTSGPAEGGDPAVDDTATTLRSLHLETPPGFPPRPSSPPPQPAAEDFGAAAGGNTGDAVSGGAETGGAGFGVGATRGAKTGGADTGGRASPRGSGAMGYGVTASRAAGAGGARGVAGVRGIRGAAGAGGAGGATGAGGAGAASIGGDASFGVGATRGAKTGGADTGGRASPRGSGAVGDPTGGYGVTASRATGAGGTRGAAGAGGTRGAAGAGGAGGATGAGGAGAASTGGAAGALDIPTPCSYAEAIAGEYSSQWQTAMDAEMASWKSTGTYVDKARYVARGFSQRQGVDYFQTFSPTPKMTTLQMLLHVAAQRDYELHSLEFSTAFLQGSLHEEIWLRRPPGFTGSFPAGTLWSLRRPVFGLRQASREWHDTLRMTLATLGFAPSTADPSLILHTDTTRPPFYVLVYIDDLVFSIADMEALSLVKAELQDRHTCTDLGELRSYLGLQITWDRARCTITLTQSHMVHQVLLRPGFQYSSPQPTPLPTGHSFSAPPLDESVELSGPYPELVGSLMYLMMCTRPDLAYPLSLLARYVAHGRHRKVPWDAVKRVLRYFCEAEIYAGAMAAQELRWLTYLLNDLGESGLVLL